MFFAPDWLAPDAAAACCWLSADCPTACVPEPPAEFWSAVWPVAFAFAAVALDSTLFDCETEPLFPGLRTRTGMFVLLAPLCVAYDSACADWLLSADCPIACVPPAHPHEPFWVWPADWPVRFAFPAVAFELAVFDCETSPPLPGLRTRTEMFWFAG